MRVQRKDSIHIRFIAECRPYCKEFKLCDHLTLASALSSKAPCQAALSREREAGIAGTVKEELFAERHPSEVGIAEIDKVAENAGNQSQ